MDQISVFSMPTGASVVWGLPVDHLCHYFSYPIKITSISFSGKPAWLIALL